MRSPKSPWVVCWWLPFSGLSTACGGSAQPAHSAANGARTCLVLSASGARAVAHLGAIEAVKHAGIQVDCVVTGGFASVAGGMYVSAPRENAGDRYLSFMDAYADQTRRDNAEHALDTAVPLAASGETDWPRFARVLDRFYDVVQIENLPLRFASVRQENGQKLQTATSGNLALAVAQNAADPAEPAEASLIDQACKSFPQARLIAINVGEPSAVLTGATHCPLLEVRVVLPVLNAGGTERVGTRGPEFDTWVRAGFDATTQALASSRWAARATDSRELASKIESSVAPAPTHASCAPRAWLQTNKVLPSNVIGVTPRSVGDLNGDALPDYAIDYTYDAAAGGWKGSTLLGSTGDTACYRVVYQGVGVAEVLPTRSNGWAELIVAGSVLTAQQGRIAGSWRARFDAGQYRVSEAIACTHADGRSVPIKECVPLGASPASAP